jgi:hypothetical protein
MGSPHAAQSLALSPAGIRERANDIASLTVPSI